MKDLIRASISMERELAERFDAFVERSGHDNRSEAIRDLIRAKLLEEGWAEEGADAIASVTLVYDHEQHRVTRELEEFGHAHHDVTCASMHIHASASVCVEVIVLRGAPAQLRHVADHLIGMPGVLHGRAVYSRIDLHHTLSSPESP